MTFLSYKLPKGAPFEFVWFPTCDRCGLTLDPVPHVDGRHGRMRAAVEAAGWRYQREHPLDTCAACLTVGRRNGTLADADAPT